MSIIFGIREVESRAVSEQELVDLAQATDRWALDGTFVRAQGRVGMGFRPYFTHERSLIDSQPIVDEPGNMVTLDGRFDNHAELCDLLGIGGFNLADSQIALAAFLRWGAACFSKFIGDWAIAIWSQKERALYLARDHAGVRSLYYEVRGHRILWATFLETLSNAASGDWLDRSYAARYISCLPVGASTPYRAIKAVPNAQFLRFSEADFSSDCHWKSTASRKILYRSDADYEDEFRHLFGRAVQRRLGGGERVLAELSGGLDSTSIVSMADSLKRTSCESAYQLIDTVSYFNDSEQSWNERPYVAITENRRGKTGHHVHLSEATSSFQMSGVPYPLPGATQTTLLREQLLADTIGGTAYRAVLSGIGGDEVLGGIPNISGGLSETLLEGNFRAFLRSAMAWSLNTRTPLIHTFGDVLQCLTTSSSAQGRSDRHDIPWLRACEHEEDRATSVRRSFRLQLSCQGLRAISNDCTLASVIESMPHTKHPFLFRREYRYPYLDRDLLDFLLNIPFEQLATPGRRRHLMRRALRTIVPEEILERRRKAYLIRSPLLSIQQAHEHVGSLFRSSRLADLGLLKRDEFLAAVDIVVKGADVQLWPHIIRTIEVELWLRATETFHGSSRFSVDLVASA